LADRKFQLAIENIEGGIVMAKRRRASNDGNTDYSVGYRKPPQHSRFRPGQSGDPTGRRKGVRNLSTDAQRTLTASVRVDSGGRSHNISTQEATLKVLRKGPSTATREPSIACSSSQCASTINQARLAHSRWLQKME
jgi:hypothetical protein